MQLSEILPRHAQLADKFSLVRSCCHTAAAVHDTGHQMMQTGRLFTGGVHWPHAGCVLSYLRGGNSQWPTQSFSPGRWDGPAATCRTARMPAFWARRTTPSCWRRTLVLRP